MSNETRKHVVQQFWWGLIELSRTAFWTMIFSAALSFCAMVWLFSPATLQGEYGAYLARSPDDAEAFATLESIRLSGQHQEHPTLLFLGSSSLAQSLADPGVLADAIEDEGSAGRWDVHILATPLQTRLDQLTIIENALRNRTAGDPPFVIAIGIGTHRMEFPAQRIIELENAGRLGVRSGWADEELVRLGGEPGRRSEFHLVENLQFYASRYPAALLRLLLFSPAKRRIAAYANAELPDQDRPRALTKTQVEYGPQGFDEYLGFLRNLSRRLATIPNVYLVFVDERLSPDFLAESRLFYLDAQLNKQFAASASSFGSPFIRMMKDAHLSPSDFSDDYHVKNGEPQKKVRIAFDREFANFLMQRRIEGGA